MYNTFQSLSSITNNSPLKHKNCKNCKHFHNNMLGAQYGKCIRFEKLDVIDWKLKYSYAHIVKKYQCKGGYFQEKQNIVNHILNTIFTSINYDKK